MLLCIRRSVVAVLNATITYDLEGHANNGHELKAYQSIVFMRPANRACQYLISNPGHIRSAPSEYCMHAPP
jgi:hypothetical protein